MEGLRIKVMRVGSAGEWFVQLKIFCNDRKDCLDNALYLPLLFLVTIVITREIM